MIEIALILLLVVAIAVVMFHKDYNKPEVEPDLDVAALFYNSVKEASDHAVRFGSSERLWDRMRWYEVELRRRGLNPDKVWSEITRAQQEGRSSDLSQCQQNKPPQ